MTYLNVHDLLVPKALSSPNMWNHVIGPPWLMIKKFSSASLKQCILLLHFGNYLLFLGLCHCICIFSSQSWFYSYALPKCLIISFLPNDDSKYSFAFPLMTNVVLRVSHKECYWAYSNYKDLFLRWAIIQ
jgi:hypothetical protein